ncbi:hypothetical protein V5799_009946 [Amblyomma americanum]|uniref:Uncharacterized protein n=1 Tax=Amblyomma americanum TaxID=6943 RepID=A0AAQ4F8Y4_AMBAM
MIESGECVESQEWQKASIVSELCVNTCFSVCRSGGFHRARPQPLLTITDTMSDSDMARNPFAALFPSMVDVQAFVQNTAEVSPRDFPLAVTEKDLATRRMESEESSPQEIISSASHVTSGVKPDDQHALSTVFEDIFRVTVSGKASEHFKRDTCTCSS